PVAGSFGSLSQTRFPHNAPAQLTIRTWLSLSPVNHVPSASAACAGATTMPTKTAAARHTPTAVVRRIVMNHLTLLCPWAGTIVDVIRLAYFALGTWGTRHSRARSSPKCRQKRKCCRNRKCTQKDLVWVGLLSCGRADNHRFFARRR